eukprot:508517-Rhodomonas_salina.2
MSVPDIAYCVHRQLAEFTEDAVSKCLQRLPIPTCQSKILDQNRILQSRHVGCLLPKECCTTPRRCRLEDVSSSPAPRAKID